MYVKTVGKLDISFELYHLIKNKDDSLSRWLTRVVGLKLVRCVDNTDTKHVQMNLQTR